MISSIAANGTNPIRKFRTITWFMCFSVFWHWNDIVLMVRTPVEGSRAAPPIYLSSLLLCVRCSSNRKLLVTHDLCQQMIQTEPDLVWRIRKHHETLILPLVLDSSQRGKISF